MHILESGLSFLNQEQFDMALKEFNAVENLLKSHEVEESYYAVLFYNKACTLQRKGQIDECIKYLNSGIESLEKEINTLNLQQLSTTSTDRSILNNNAFTQQEIKLGSLLHKIRY